MYYVCTTLRVEEMAPKEVGSGKINRIQMNISYE